MHRIQKTHDFVRISFERVRINFTKKNWVSVKVKVRNFVKPLRRHNERRCEDARSFRFEACKSKVITGKMKMVNEDYEGS